MDGPVVFVMTEFDCNTLKETTKLEYLIELQSSNFFHKKKQISNDNHKSEFNTIFFFKFTKQTKSEKEFNLQKRTIFWFP